MRLTLRTMLAHLDGILDQADQEDMSRKIADSEFATDLAHRIADCTKRLRLPAPKLLGKGTALDPNTVAEYLDSTLPPERIPDFEKVCLESDVHLAEVAACHHILTMIVHQPAQFDPASRQRMYGLLGGGVSEDAGEPVTEAVAAAAVPETSTVGSSSAEMPTFVPAPPRKPEVPDYLREGARRRRLSTVLIAVAAASLMVAVLFGRETIMSWFGAGESTVAQNGSGSAPAEKKEQPATPADDASSAPSEAERPAEPPVAPTVVEKPEVTEPDPADRAADVAASPPVEDTPPPAPSDTGDAPPIPMPPVDVDPTSEPQQPNSAPRPARAEPIGRLVSAEHVLLRFDATTGEWHRVADGGSVFGGDRLVALPTFRPKIVLPGGVMVELVGDSREGTIVELDAPRAGAPPAVRIVHGRLAKITAPGQMSVPLRLRFGKQEVTVTLADAITQVSIDVRRAYERGADPMKAAEPIRAEFFVTAGSIDVSPPADAAGKTLTVNESMMLTWNGAADAAPQPMNQAPAWIEKSDVRSLSSPGSPSVRPAMLPEASVVETLDDRARNDLEKSFIPGKGIGVILDERFHGPRPEERSLAARASAYLGRMGPLVIAALKDDRVAWNWRARAVDGLRLAVGQGPEMAALVRTALLKEFGDGNGAQLYRILCGYSPADLRAGADARLVDGLENPELAVRTLTFYNLESIVGISLRYAPEMADTPTRRGIVMNWRSKQKTGEIAQKGAKSPAAATAAPAAKAAAPAEKVESPTPATVPDAPPPTPPDPAPDAPPPPAAGPDGL